ncbi:MAG: HD domain-containing phosphohydrolase [Thermodesulfobacteriota bacterium]
MRVLVAEDEAVSRNLLGHYLQRWGHEVISVTDGAQALEAFLSQPVEIVVTDWIMPRMDGLELAGRIRDLGREGWPFVYIIMLTGRDRLEDRVRGLEQGAADDYVVKPFEPAELKARLLVGERTVRLERQLSEINRTLEQKVRRQTRVIRRSQEETIHRLLMALQHRDVETGDHVRRIGLMSAAMAEALGWPAEAVENIRVAAPMHDIGKIGVPDRVLRKPGRLDAEEFAAIKTHCAVGHGILGGSQLTMLRMADDIAFCHHEHWDGGGYPRGLAGEDIPEAARIVAVVDSFDAMTSDRVYRGAMPEEEALAIMRQGRGSHLDPRLLDVFLAQLPAMRQIRQYDR